jgi:oligopeptide transport system substrate-binding protein
MTAKLGSLALVALLAAACARDPQPPSTPLSAASTSEAVLLRGNGPEPDSLDPQKARSVEAHTILRDLCEPLTTLARDASPAPGSAQRWSTSDDGLTWIFELRPEARWSNGDPVVAADFVAGLQRLVEPATASQYAQVIDVVVNASEVIAAKKGAAELGVRALDERRVQVSLRAPAAYLPSLLSHPSTCPVHRPSFARSPEAYVKPGAMVSNGAFVLSEWVHGAHVLARRNRFYWNDAQTRLDAVKYLHITDENAELTRYRAGELHVTNVVPRSQFDWIRANLAAELHVSPQLTVYYYGFNLDRPLFRDEPGLRRALSLVIDRERLVESVLRVGELPAYGWVPPGVDGYASQSFDYRNVPLAERVEEARRLYADAGFSRGRPLRFELRYNSGEVHDRLAVAIASMWKEALGAETRLVAVEFKSLLQDIDRREVELFRSSWVGDYNDAYTFAQYWKSDFGINLPRYRSAAYDALVVRAAATVDPAARRALLEQAERTMLADHPMIPLYFYVNKHLVKPEVRGWYDNVMNVVYSKDLALTR